MAAKKSSKKKKNLYSIIGIILGILVIGITVILAQKVQIFHQRANSLLDSALEVYYNPFGDPWAEKKQPTKSMIQAALTTGCYRTGPKSDQTTPSVEEINFWSKSNTGFVFEECVIFSEDPRTIHYFSDLTKLLSPSEVKYVGYSVVLQGDINQTGVSDFYNAAEKKPVLGFEDFFLYNKDGSIYMSGGHPILNMTSPRYRELITKKMADYMERTGMMGVLIDSMYSKEMLENRKTIDLDTVVSHTGTPIINWNASVIDFMRDLNTAIDKTGKDRLLFTNVDVTDTTFVHGLLTVVDGIMLEDPIGRLDTDFSSRAKTLAPALDTAAQLNKYVIVVVNTNINCPNPGAISCYNEYLPGGALGNRQKELNDYYLAGYLNLMRNNKTVFMYYVPTQAGPQFVSQTYFKNWDTEIGDPVGNMQEVAKGVFMRSFQNGLVYFNNSDTPYQAPNRNFQTTNDEPPTITIPAKSGVILPGSVSDMSPVITAPSHAPSLSRFQLQPASVSCAGTGNPRVLLQWTSAGDHEYKVFIRDRATDIEKEIGRTRGNAFTIEVSHGLLPNHSYGFLIGFHPLEGGTVFSDNAWSDGIYGWTTIPSCTQ